MGRITLDQVSAFLHVVRLGGVGKAAEALRLTQPAVTVRIKNLERTVGGALFDRAPGGLRLTERGARLVGYAERLEHLASLVERDVVAPEGVTGRLRLGVSETIAQCWLPDMISRIHARYPRVEIEINVDISVGLRAALLDRALDLAVLLGPVSEYSVTNIDLPGFGLGWYASPAKLAGADPASLLAGPVLTYARQTRPFRELKALLQDRVGAEVPLFPSTSLSACFRLVEADLGVAALPRALARAHVARGTIREFDPGWVPPPLRFTASHLAEPAGPVIEAAAQLAREAALAFDADKGAL